MSLVLIAPGREMEEWKTLLQETDRNLDVAIWPDVPEPERVQFAVCWKHPRGALERFPNLKAVSSLGAGVDHLLDDPDLPDGVTVCRIVTPSLVRQMQEYVLSALLNYQRHTLEYVRQKGQVRWQPRDNRKAEELPVGVMGLGKIGRPVAEFLSANGYTVRGWSASPHTIEGIETFHGSDRLTPFLEKVRVLVCLLPLTSETEDLLDLDLFRSMVRPGYLVNVARGEHLVEEDLIYAMDKGWVDGACLDVFREEPLGERHPFWNRPSVMITPHVASTTPPGEAAGQIVENYKRALSGMELNNTVSREKGY